jgi:epoxyqueuosine reductase
VSLKMKEGLPTNPARFLRQQIKEFVRNSPDNHLSFMNNQVIFDDPLVKFADGDDLIFTEYKRIIAPTHLTPREAFVKAYIKNSEDTQAHLSVISWILPIAEETLKSNRSEKRLPSRLWSHTRWYGEKFNDKLRAYVVSFLINMGYLAVAPILQPYFKVYNNKEGMYSNWSERHIAYAVGHGTFSLSDGFITDCGIAHRCGSVVTNLFLPASHRTPKSPFSNCLFYIGIDCKACRNRCPAGAITEKGHDKNKCRQYLHSIGYTPQQIKDYDNDKSLVGCGLCQTKVPCEFQNPTKKLKKKTEK